MNFKQTLMLSGVLAAAGLSAVELPLTNPQAPFVSGKETIANLQKVEPVFDAAGKRFIFGSKIVTIFPSGFLRLTESGKEIAKLYFYASTPFSSWMTNTNTAAKAPFKSNSHLSFDTFTADEKTKTITVKGTCPFHKIGTAENWKPYQFSVTLQDNGKLKIQLKYERPAEMTNRGIHFMLQNSKSTGYTLKGVTKTYPVHPKQHQYISPKNLQLHFAVKGNDYTVNCLDMQTAYVRAKGLVAFSGHTNKKDPGNVSITIELDLLSWGGKAAVGAVNMMDVEAMDAAIPASRNLLHNAYLAQGLNHIGGYNFLYPWLVLENIKLSDKDPKFGTHCLLMRAPTGSLDLPVVSAASGTYTFSFYAKAEGEAYATAEFFDHGIKKNGNKTFQLKPGWNRYEMSCKVTAASGLKVRMGVGTKNKEGVNVYLDGFQLEAGSKATVFDTSPVTARLLTSAEDDFIRSGDRINARLRLSTLKEKVTGKATITVSDIFGTELYARKNFCFSFMKSKGFEIPLELDGKIPDGIHRVKVAFDVDGKKYQEYFRFSVMPFFKNKHRIKNLFSQYYHGSMWTEDVYPGYEKYLKRCMAIGAGSHTHQPLPTKELQALLDKYNFEWLDTDIGGRTWDKTIKQMFPHTKPEPGHSYYRFFYNKKHVDLWAGKGGLVVDHRLDGGWTPEFRKKVIAAVQTIVKKSSPRRIYHVGSEWAPEIKNDPHYIDLVLAVREAVKSVYPDSMFCEAGTYNMDVGGGVREIDSTLTRLNKRMPIEVIHTHTYTKDILALEPNFKALINVVENKHGYKNVKYFFGEGMHYGPYEIPVWGLESANWDGRGWISGSPITYDIGWTEKVSAAYFMRSWLIFLTKIDQVIAACSSIANSKGTFELDVQLRPRVYQKIPNTLSMLLGNAKRFVKDVSFAQYTKCLIWEDEKGRPVAAVWYQDPLADSGMKQGLWAAAKLPADIEIFDMMGAKRTARKDGKFPVSVFPFFFRGKAGTVDQFVKIFAEAELDGKKAAVFQTNLELVSPKTAQLTLTNYKARNVSGLVTAGGKNKNINLAPLGKTNITVPLTKMLPFDKFTETEVKYTVRSGNTVQDGSDKFVGLAVKRFTGDWNKIPSFRIKNKSQNVKYPESDFAATGQIAWDKNNFYLRVTVKDNMFVHTERKGIGARWNNDTLQFYFDTRCSARKNNVRTFDDDDYAYDIHPSPDGKSAELFRFRTPDIQLTLGITAPKDLTYAKDVPCKFTRTKDGYIYETALPARYVLPARLEAGYAMGFALFVNDRDEGKDIKQSLTLTPQGTAPFNRPHLYPLIILTDEQ